MEALNNAVLLFCFEAASHLIGSYLNHVLVKSFVLLCSARRKLLMQLLHNKHLKTTPVRFDS